MRKAFAILLAVLFAGLSTGGCDAPEKQVILKLGHSLDPLHPVHQGMVAMAEKLQELSGGSMRIDIYPSGQLGSERELIELLQIGSLAMTKVSASPMESFVPELKVFSLPYVFRDQEHYWRVLKSPLGRRLLQAGEQVRLRGLAYYDAGSRSFYTSERPIHTPEDLKGLKIRVQKSQTSVAMVESLGGSATPISWGELYTALQQGVVDGAENNPPSFYRSKHYEVCKYYTLDQHTFIPDMLFVSSHVWNSLTPRQQQWLQAAADESMVVQRKLWRTATREALREVEKAGVEIIHPDQSVFTARVAGMREALAHTQLNALLQEIDSI